MKTEDTTIDSIEIQHEGESTPAPKKERKPRTSRKQAPAKMPEVLPPVEEPVIEEPVEEAPKAPKRMADQLRAARARYENGRNNGDFVAQALEGMELDQIMAMADEVCGVEPGFHAEKYAHLNNGQKRMNCGNKIRNRATKSTFEAMAAKVTH